jgi:hypothetical protein
MIGTSRIENTVSMNTPRKNQAVPPKARRASARVSTSTTVEYFGVNHITKVIRKSAIAVPGSTMSDRFFADAVASVPSTSIPIQAGEPRNIKSANTS